MVSRKLGSVAALGILIGASASASGPAPSISSLSALTGAEGDSVTVSGSNFILSGCQPPQLWFNAQQALVSGTPSATQITATVPVAARTGKLSVRVRCPDGMRYGYSAVNFIVSPQIVVITPSSGAVASEFQINGIGIQSTSRVLLGGQSVRYQILPTGRILVTVPGAMSSGAKPLVVETLQGKRATSPIQFSILGTQAIESVAPMEAKTGQSIQIRAVGVPQAKWSMLRMVSFGGINSTGFDASAAPVISAAIPSNALSGPIQLIFSDGSRVSGIQQFRVLSPRISEIAPLTGPPGTIVMIRGQNFHPGLKVRINNAGDHRFAYVSSSEIRVAIPGATPVGQSLQFKVEYPLPIGTSSLARSSFTVNSDPSFAHMLPSSGTAGSSVSLYVNRPPVGMPRIYFQKTTSSPAVEAQIVSYPNASSPAGTPIVIRAPLALDADSTYGIVIRWSEQQALYSTSRFLATGSSAPVITAISPPAAGAGKWMRIFGKNLPSAPIVTFPSGRIAARVGGASSTEILALVPAEAGNGYIQVSGFPHPDLVIYSPPFVFVEAPTLTSVAPQRGAASSLVTLNGTNLQHNPIVRMNGANLPFMIGSSGRTLRATIPPGTQSGMIEVITLGGFAQIGPFTVTASPQVEPSNLPSLVPSVGPSSAPSVVPSVPPSPTAAPLPGVSPSPNPAPIQSPSVNPYAHQVGGIITASKSVPVGTRVSIYLAYQKEGITASIGQAFKFTKRVNRGHSVYIQAESNTAGIRCTVIHSAMTMPNADVLDHQVHCDSGGENGLGTITQISPSPAYPGDTVTITGSGFHPDLKIQVKSVLRSQNPRVLTPVRVGTTKLQFTVTEDMLTSDIAFSLLKYVEVNTSAAGKLRIGPAYGVFDPLTARHDSVSDGCVIGSRGLACLARLPEADPMRYGLGSQVYRLVDLGLTAGQKAIGIIGEPVRWDFPPNRCALIQDSADRRGIKCWGNNRYGELGIGTRDSNANPDAVWVSGLSISSGKKIVGLGYGLSQYTYGQNCAIVDSLLNCWGGYNAPTAPQMFYALHDFTALSIQGSCLTLADGPGVRAYCLNSRFATGGGDPGFGSQIRKLFSISGGLCATTGPNLKFICAEEGTRPVYAPRLPPNTSPIRLVRKDKERILILYGNGEIWAVSPDAQPARYPANLPSPFGL